ncbi:peptidoglycan-binding protein [Brachybacterium tyrofermentans]|uniref:peptidoglycan-binding protein n=1 Tax=Brachybacterium tyrofermentans TaxID=47848 RepID=UPI001D024954|nr:peptidoglycan-binding protein [Brachybacterium tyrofermentans]
MAIMPGASRVQKFSGNRHKRTVTKIVLHTTEGSSWPGYGGGGSAPHFTVKPGKATKANIRQHIDTAYSAKALVNRSGGVETNNGGCVQIEFVGSCDRAYAKKHGLFFTEDADDDDLASLAAVLAWIHDEHGVPLVIDGNLDWPTTNAAYRTAPQRLSYKAWNEYRGVLGHTHVPENDHWDPGAFPIARLLKLAGGSKPLSGGSPLVTGSAGKAWTESPRVNGFSKAEITSIQNVLLGFDLDLGHWGADGKYGDTTGEAVQTLQAELHITPTDGIYGPGTEKAVMTIKSDIAEIKKNTSSITRDDKQVSLRQELADTKTTVLELRKELDWVRRVAEANQKRIDKGNAQTGPITRHGKEISLRQELADAKTVTIANAGGITAIQKSLDEADVDATEAKVPDKIQG